MSTRKPAGGKNLEKARAALQQKRQAQQLLADAENLPPRVSPRTVENLTDKLESAHSELEALRGQAKLLSDQRDAQKRALQRLQASSQLSMATLQQQHEATVATLQQRILVLEGELQTAQNDITGLRTALFRAENREERLVAARDTHWSGVLRKELRNATTLLLKKSGRYTDAIRCLAADLVAICKVPTSYVDLTIRMVAEAAKFTVLPAREISPRSVIRFVGEAGIASELYVAERINDAEVTGLCFSADGTSNRNLHYMSRHITVTKGGAGETLCLGVTRPVDHTARTTFNGWKDIFSIYGTALDASGILNGGVFNHFRLWRNFKGSVADHAADQVATTDLLVDEKRRMDHLERGNAALKAMSVEDYQSVVSSGLEQLLDSIGNTTGTALNPEQRAEAEQQNLVNLQLRLGAEEFAKLSTDEQEFALSVSRGGCGAHKDANALLYGHKRMIASWRAVGLAGPIKLFNRDNAAATDGGTSEAQSRAEDVTQAGGVKLGQLFGALVNHPDEGKGYGDLYRIFLEDSLGYCPKIPNTMASRFQSNYEMARFIVRYHSVSLDFLEQARLAKGSRTLNHMEQNIWDGLHDDATLCELVVLALYGTTIGRPYMAQIRASGLVNLMELGPLHLDVIALCDKLSEYPELLFYSPDDDEHCPGSLDGKPYDDPHLFRIIAELESQGRLANLQVPLREFFAGAADGWRQFSKEFLPGGSIATASAAHRAAVILPATNDQNESLVGAHGQWKRRRPNMRVRFFNAAVMHRRNKTRRYLQSLPPPIRRFITREHRRRDGLGLSKLEDRRQAAHERAKKAQGEAAEARKKEKAAKQEQELNAIAPLRFRSLAAMQLFQRRKKLIGKVIDQNLRWHRFRGSAAVLKKLKLTKPLPTKVADKQRLLEAILDYQDNPDAHGGLEEAFRYKEGEVDMPDGVDDLEDGTDFARIDFDGP